MTASWDRLYNKIQVYKVNRLSVQIVVSYFCSTCLNIMCSVCRYRSICANLSIVKQTATFMQAFKKYILKISEIMSVYIVQVW